MGLARTYQQSRMLMGVKVEDAIYLSILGVHNGHLRPVVLPKDRQLRKQARTAAERVAIDHKLSESVGALSHGEHRQLAIAMALAAEPKVMMLDEPAAGLSRGERQLLTELLQGLDRSITLILIEHDMDVALNVAERVTMMHDGSVIVARHARRDPRQRGRARPLPRPPSLRGGRVSEQPLLAVEGLSAYYGTAQCLHDVSFEMGRESVAIIGRNGMGKTTLCAALMGLSPPRTSGSLKFEGVELLGRPSYKIARAGWGTCRRAAGSSRRSRSTSTEDLGAKRSRRRLDDRADLRALPRLADRRKNGGAQPGRRATAAIGRALLGNPKLLIMDERPRGSRRRSSTCLSTHSCGSSGRGSPSCSSSRTGRRHLAGETAACDGGGEIAAETTAEVLEGDVELQRRYLGVEPLAH